MSISTQQRSDPISQHRLNLFDRLVLWLGVYIGLNLGLLVFMTLGSPLNPFPFEAPPLHLRFVSSLYIGATIMALMSALSNSVDQIRIFAAFLATFTSAVLIATVLHAELFTFPIIPPPPSEPRSGVAWLVLYIFLPLYAFWLLRRPRGIASNNASNPLPAAFRFVLIAFSVLGAILGIYLFVFPSHAGSIWPWNISVFLSQLYAGPILAYSVTAFLTARLQDRGAAVLPAAGTAAFAWFAIFGSVLHFNVFDPQAISTFFWFAILIALGLISTMVVVLGLTDTAENKESDET